MFLKVFQHVCTCVVYKRNLGIKEFSQFLKLSAVEKYDENLHLEALHSDFNQQFEDIVNMNISDWFLDPF